MSDLDDFKNDVDWRKTMECVNSRAEEVRHGMSVFAAIGRDMRVNPWRFTMSDVIEVVTWLENLVATVRLVDGTYSRISVTRPAAGTSDKGKIVIAFALSLDGLDALPLNGEKPLLDYDDDDDDEEDDDDGEYFDDFDEDDDDESDEEEYDDDDFDEEDD